MCILQNFKVTSPSFQNLSVDPYFPQCKRLPKQPQHSSWNTSHFLPKLPPHWNQHSKLNKQFEPLQLLHVDLNKFV